MKRRRFDELVEEAVMSLPEEFRNRLDNVLISVQDDPDPELLDEMGEESLLGVYLGVPATERSLDDLYHLPEQVIIFQNPIESICETEEEIVEEVRITVVHEIGHHFGLSEEEIVAILGE